MAEFKDKHNIDKMEENIYSHDFENKVSPRASFSPHTEDVGTAWKHETMVDKYLHPDKPKKVAGSLVKKIFIISIIFFVICAGVAAFIFFGGFNLISSDKVEVSLIGPVSIAAGEDLSLDVDIQNKNGSALQNAELYIDFPDGTKEAGNLTQDYLHEKQDLGTIDAHSEVKRTIHSVLFGKESSVKEIKVTIEYGLNSSSAVYKREKTYKVTITSAPLSFTINRPQQATAGEGINFSVDITSNATVPLSNLLFKIDYPFGFEFVSSDPAPTSDTNIWSIPVLQPGEKKTFVIKGSAEGQEGDERAFRFTVGAADALDEKEISTAYLSSLETVIIRRPPLGIKFSLGDSTGDAVAAPGDSVNGDMTITNNLSTELVDAEVELAFTGNVFNPQSPDSKKALYRLPNQTLYWDKTTFANLSDIAPGGTVDLDFQFASLPQETISAIKNGTIKLSAVVRGKTIGVEHIVTTTGSKTVKIQPKIALIPRLVYSTGSFTNEGPIPPKTETKTTYTVIWTVTSSTNDLSGVEVRGTLPSYVQWVGAGSNSDVTWNVDKNEVVWHVGDIPAGVAGRPAKEASFQIAFTPAFSQIHTLPRIVDSMSLKAVDTFTKRNISISGLWITNQLLSDPKYQNTPQFVQP